MSTAAPLTVPRGPGAARRGRVQGALGLLRATGPVGIVAAIIIAVAIHIAVFGTFIATYDPNLPNLSLAWGSPSGGHLLGYDFQGRDVLSRLLVGARTALLGPLAVVAGSMAAGVLLAVTAAWRRGASDAVISSGLAAVIGLMVPPRRTAIRRATHGHVSKNQPNIFGPAANILIVRTCRPNTTSS